MMFSGVILRDIFFGWGLFFGLAAGLSLLLLLLIESWSLVNKRKANH